MNNINFTGNLGKDAQVRDAGQAKVCSFGVAAKSGYGDKQQTIWIDCSIWGKRAESGLPGYLKKGQSVAISGELGTREYEGKTYVTCNVNSVTLTGGKTESQQPQQSQQMGFQQGQAVNNDDVPF
jgi:single-strand DNA-binding protein